MNILPVLHVIIGQILMGAFETTLSRSLSLGLSLCLSLALSRSIALSRSLSISLPLFFTLALSRTISIYIPLPSIFFSLLSLSLFLSPSIFLLYLVQTIADSKYRVSGVLCRDFNNGVMQNIFNKNKLRKV